MSNDENRLRQDSAPDAIPDIALTHGQTIWLMGELGLREGVATSTFNYYIKSLRKLGIPFEKGKGQEEGHRRVTYDFEELMELTVALLLRVYGILPDEVTAGLRRFRNELRPIYRQAYLDAKRPFPPSARLSSANGDGLDIKGAYLDLNIRYSSGRIIEFGPPRLMSPLDAVRIYLLSEIPARCYLPLNLSVVADRIIMKAQALPPVRRDASAQKAPTT